MTESMPHRTRRARIAWITATALAFAGPARGESPSAAPPDSTCPPPGWQVGKMAAAGMAPGERLDAAHVLRWRILEDDRPLRVESAIVWARVHRRGGGPAWILAHVFRHPGDRRTRHWRLAHVYDVEQFHGRTVHSTPPGAAAVDSLVRVSAWNWWTEGFRTLGGGDCAEAWRAAFGIDPPEK